MKTKLLKLVLCAFVAALPMGAWGADSWPFSSTAFTPSELANIKADGTSIWSPTTENTRYLYVPALTTAAALTAQGTELDFTNGLKFQCLSGNGFRVYSNYALELMRTAVDIKGASTNPSYLIIPDLPEDAVVTIRFKSNSGTNTVQLISDDLDDTTSPAATSDATYVGTVKADGDVKIGYKVTVETGKPVCQIRSISYVVNHNVTVLYNGEGGYGTASAAASSVQEGQTTIITASPATGYKVTSWDVSGTGSTIDPSGDSNTTTLTMGTADATVTCTFAPQTYTVTHTLSSATAKSGATGADAATYNTQYSAEFKANDDYVLPSTITVSIGDEEKTVNTDYTWNQATGTVTILAAKVTGNIVITVTATKAAVVTKWNFEEYMPGHNLFGSSTGQDVKEFTEGLYLHTRDADSENHWLKAATATISSTMAADITTQTQTYERGKSYTGILINTGNVTVSADDETANVSCNGFSYKAPAGGTLYYTFYTTSRTHIYTYKNAASSPTDDTIDPTSKGGIGKEYSLAVSSGDVVYVTTSGTKGTIYLLDVLFVPTTPESTHTTVTFKSAGGGYASFSSTKNYTVPTGVTAYYVSSVDNTKNEAVMKTIDAGSVIPACTGVILYKDGVTTEDVAVEMTTAGKTDAVDNHLRANIVAYDLPADDGTNYNYTLAAGPTFKHSSGSGTFAAGKAFLRTTVNVPGGGEARGFNLVFDEDETTAVADVRTKKEDVSGDYYDLSGRKVVQPTRGLYIVNGKKVFIK